MRMFYQKFQLQLFLVLIITKISTCDVGQIKCSMYENNRKCTLSGVTITSKNYTFVPVAPDSNAVIKFDIIQSSILVLTSQICTTLTKIKYFNAVDQHIEIVEDYAFNNCTDVTEINLEKNNIHKLGVGIFSNSKQLKKLHILGGSIDHIDVDLFSSLGELKQLLFSSNGLRELPVEAVKNLKKLELLYIYSNNLDDLDAKGLVDSLPNLKSVYLNDNNFHCDRLIEIMDIFKAGTIAVNDYTYLNSIRRRDYVPRKVKSIICLTQAQLDTEKLKKALTGSLDDLKDLPIGKAVIQLKEVVRSGFEDSDSAIVALSNKLNETSDDLNDQISNLNATLQNNLFEDTDSANELKKRMETVQQELDQKIKDNLAGRQELERRLDDSTAAQQQLEQKLNANLAVQQRLEQKLNDTVESNRKHTEAITSLMDKCRLLDEIKNGNSSRTNDSYSSDIVEIWVCLIILIVIDAAIMTIGIRFIRKLRRVSENVPLLCHEQLSDRDSHLLLKDTFT